MGGSVDDHPVIKLRYRPAPRLGKCRWHNPMQETRDGTDKHSRAEGHCLPLMPEIRLAHRARVIQEEPIEHCVNLARTPVQLQYYIWRLKVSRIRLYK